MKLIRARVKNFRSVEDSNEFDISGLTCLVGKNEAGKTAVLHALYGLRPFRSYAFDRVRDYPRRYLSRFDERHPDGESEVIRTWWVLESDDLAAVEEELGEGIFTSNEFEVWTGIGCETSYWRLAIDPKACLLHLEKKHKLDAAERSALKNADTTEVAVSLLEKMGSRTEKQSALLVEMKAFRKSSAEHVAIDILRKRSPKFFYTSHFERMSGEISLNKLAQDKQHNRVSVEDRIFLDFLEYAGTTLEELQSSKKYEELKAQCEGASNDITDEIFQFWSQNEALAVKIELGEGKADDPLAI